MSKRQSGKSDSTDASAYSRRVAIADSAWSAQDRVRSGSSRALKGTATAVSSPFERSSYFLRERLVWPAEDRLATMGRPARALASAAAVVLAVAAGVAGLIWAAPDGSQQPPVTRISEAAAPIAAAPAAPQEQTEPTLHGAAPVFKPGESKGATTAVNPAEAIIKSESSPQAGADADATTSSETLSSDAASSSSVRSKPQVDGPPAGPVAIAVAEDFAGAFVRYETGGTDAEVRQAFGATTTPELAKALLKRPPRLPANVKVPKAKVLNVVPAPSNGGVYPVSVSLLRVGVTSELRLNMEKLKGDGWRVTNVLG